MQAVAPSAPTRDLEVQLARIATGSMREWTDQVCVPTLITRPDESR